MEKERIFAMLDTLITAGDEGLSYDSIVSIPETSFLDDSVELFQATRAAISHGMTGLLSKSKVTRSRHVKNTNQAHITSSAIPLSQETPVSQDFPGLVSTTTQEGSPSLQVFPTPDLQDPKEPQDPNRCSHDQPHRGQPFPQDCPTLVLEKPITPEECQNTSPPNYGQPCRRPPFPPESPALVSEESQTTNPRSYHREPHKQQLSPQVSPPLALEGSQTPNLGGYIHQPRKKRLSPRVSPPPALEESQTPNPGSYNRHPRKKRPFPQVSLPPALEESQTTNPRSNGQPRRKPLQDSSTPISEGSQNPNPRRHDQPRRRPSSLEETPIPTSEEPTTPQAPHIGKECARGEDENARVLPVDMGELGQPDPAVLQEPPRKREVTHADIDQDNETAKKPEAPQVLRCTCHSTSEKPRNLVVFIDGTSNKFGPKKSNVRKLSCQLKTEGCEIEQHKYYLKGVGAYEDDHLPLLKRMRNKISSMVEMAIARDVEENIKDAYGWLAEKYQEGDRIYLFGFSRGAYQVRALASMVHEVGLVREGRELDRAYRTYKSIDRCKQSTLDIAKSFKKEFCWKGVRIHFVGVWDTVSSVGIVKTDVHITASATVTNACHFRHALALDERRVKFMPEYFSEMNTHRHEIESRRFTGSDVKEVWFAGCHSDVGGANRKHDQNQESYSVHAGNVPLLWMKQEAAASGLVFEPEVFAWVPRDVDFGRKDSLTFFWKVLEIFPVRHQVSFSGTGRHEWRWHQSRPRSVIPGQQIHYSVLSGDFYRPRATLGYGISIPIMPVGASDELWATEFPDEEATTLTSLLSKQQTTLQSLEKVLFLLDSRLDNKQTIPKSQWSEDTIPKEFGFATFALAVIHCVTSDSISSDLAANARKSLRTVLSNPKEHHYAGTLYVLRFSTKYKTLRQRFIAPEVVGALMVALDYTLSHSEKLLQLVVDCLCNLLDDDDLRGDSINQLSPGSGGTGTGETRLSLALGTKRDNHLLASLKIIASLAQYQPGPCEPLKPRIIDLAKKKRGPVGMAAVNALVALHQPLTNEIHFSNILSYLGNALPRLDVEGGSTPLGDNTGASPPVSQLEGFGGLDVFMPKLVRAIESDDAHQRITSTLALLKLRKHLTVEVLGGVLDVFIKQLERKDTSLLAAYALKTCLTLTMLPPLTDDLYRHVAKLITAMVDKDWFDDAVGRIEGFEIFRGLMESAPLRRLVVNLDIYPTLQKKLGTGDRHEIRMGMICLDIFERQYPLELERMVGDSLIMLKNDAIWMQKRGVNILSALALTYAGEEAIKRYTPEMLEMLEALCQSLTNQTNYRTYPHICSALFALFQNETLRDHIINTQKYNDFKSDFAARRWSHSVSHLVESSHVFRK